MYGKHLFTGTMSIRRLRPAHRAQLVSEKPGRTDSMSENDDIDDFRSPFPETMKLLARMPNLPLPDRWSYFAPSDTTVGIRPISEFGSPILERLRPFFVPLDHPIFKSKCAHVMTGLAVLAGMIPQVA